MTKGGGDVKNLKKLMSYFMNGPKQHEIVPYIFFEFAKVTICSISQNSNASGFIKTKCDIKLL